MENRRLRARPGIPTIAVAESRELARLLIEAFDRTAEGHCHEDLSCHDVETVGDGQLDCHELPMRTFHAVDALGCEDGHVSFHELERAFMYMPPADRRRLIDDLREPAERSRHHYYRIGLNLVAGFFLFPVAGFVGMAVSPIGGAAAGAVGGFLFLKGIAHWVASHRAGQEVVRLLDAAL